MSITKQPKLSVPPMTSARRLHPEDLSVGDNVAISQQLFQVASFVWCGVDLTTLPADRMVHIPYMPTEFEIHTVKSVCLPFVHCQTSTKTHVVHDVRQVQFMKLDREFSAAVRSGFKENIKPKKSKKKRKRKSKHK